MALAVAHHLKHPHRRIELHPALGAAFEERRFELIEAVGEHIVDRLFAVFPAIQWVQVRVKKPSAPIAMVAGEAAIELHRHRSDR